MFLLVFRLAPLTLRHILGVHTFSPTIMLRGSPDLGTVCVTHVYIMKKRSDGAKVNPAVGKTGHPATFCLSRIWCTEVKLANPATRADSRNGPTLLPRRLVLAPMSLLLSLHRIQKSADICSIRLFLFVFFCPDSRSKVTTYLSDRSLCSPYHSMERWPSVRLWFSLSVYTFVFRSSPANWLAGEIVSLSLSRTRTLWRLCMSLSVKVTLREKGSFAHCDHTAH